MADQTSHDIICLSSQSWDDGMWTNKQHIMSRLAERHRVIHVNFGLDPLPVYLYKRITQQPSDLMRPLELLTDGVVHRDQGLYLAESYIPISAALLEIDSEVRNFWVFDFKIVLLQTFLDRHDIDDPIVWVYHPGYGEAVDRLSKKLLVYDCVDQYTGFPKYDDHQDWIRRRERRLCQKADVVFTTSQTLYDDKSQYNPEHTHLVHNVGDAEHFSQARDPQTPVAEEIASLEGPVIGFVGAVSDYKLDSSWLLEASRRHPDWEIVVIGPIGLADDSTVVTSMQEADNIHLLGYRDYEDLPSYHKGFDVAVIPYRINEYTRSVFPIKFFEFLATGTPVVISNLPSLEPYYSSVRVAETAEAFVDQCEDALEDDPPEARRERIELADQHTWSKRIDDMMEVIEDRLEAT